ncbi:hypothetical protein ABHN11_12845 [Brevibacillus centrosporus]|uniref:hypothetical protein n=1 Tax=Brevibacillus centrosporus TaxID=54910 RepID=UPI003D190523
MGHHYEEKEGDLDVWSIYDCRFHEDLLLRFSIAEAIDLFHSARYNVAPMQMTLKNDVPECIEEIKLDWGEKRGGWLLAYGKMEV